MTTCRRWIIVMLVLAVVGCAFGTESRLDDEATMSAREVELSPYFRGINPDDATFVLLNTGSREISRHNPVRARERFILW